MHDFQIVNAIEYLADAIADLNSAKRAPTKEKRDWMCDRGLAHAEKAIAELRGAALMTNQSD